MKRNTLELSKRLVVTPFFESRKPTLHRTVAEAMSHDTFVIDPDDGIFDAAALLVAARVDGLPVVTSDGDVVGVVTLTDVLYRCRVPHGSIADALKDWLGGKGESLSKITGIRVSEIMTAPVVTIRPTDTLQVAARRMLDHRVNRLPVVEEEGRLLGIITRSDIIAEMVTWAEQQE